MEKVHAVVARSTFGSKKWQNTRGSDGLLEVERWKKCTPLWREAHLEVKSGKTPQRRTTFGSADVEKVPRRCGAKHIFMKHVKITGTFGPLLDSAMWKKCTPLWRQAHFHEKC